MKKILLQTIVGCSALLSFGLAQAASGPVGKTYGGFAPGKTFTFTVTQKTSTKTTGLTVIKKAAVPNGIPNYAKGQQVKFTIGDRGQLTAKGFSMKFKSDGGTANAYATTSTTTQPNVGLVHKNLKNRPTGVSLSFFKVSISGFTVSTNAVYYTLE
jgi:hypothetical protein